MAVTLIFLAKQSTIAALGLDTLTLDASLSETHTAKNTVTTHPVEQGAKITDHKLREPDGLILEGLITNDPMPDPAQAPTPQRFQPPQPAGAQNQTQPFNYSSTSSYQPDRAGKAYSTLLALLDSTNLLVVTTGIRSYDNMVLTDLSVPRDAQSGQALRFTATFTTIRIVTNQTVQVQAKITGANGTVNKNKKVTADTDAAVSNKTAAKALKDGLPTVVAKLKAAFSGFAP